MSTARKDKNTKLCANDCHDKEGNVRTVEDGSEWDICKTCRSYVAVKSKVAAEDPEAFSEFDNAHRVKSLRLAMIRQGGKDKQGKLDMNDYLGRLLYKRLKHKEALKDRTVKSNNKPKVKVLVHA